MSDQISVSDRTAISMPMKNLIGIIGIIATGIFAWTNLSQRVTELETSRQLMEADLLKKASQTPVDQEQYMLIEFTSGQVEEIADELSDMRNNKVNISRLQQDMDKALKDIEDIKDKVRANGNH